MKTRVNTSNRLISGAFSLTLSTIIVKLLGLIYKIPLSNILGDEGMGYFNSAYTVYAFFYLICTAGVPKAVTILVTEAKAKGRAAEESAIVRVAMVAFLSLGALFTVALAALANPLAELIGNSKSAATMIAIAPSIVIVSLAGVVRGYLGADMRLLDIAVSQVIEGVGKLALGLVFAIYASRKEFGLEMISAMTILGVSVGALLGLVYLFICAKNLKKTENVEQNFKIDTTRAKILGRILSISIPITLSAAVMSMTNLIDLGLIMRGLLSLGYTESEASALYGNYTTLAVPMFNLVIAVITPISIAFTPVFARAGVEGNGLLLSDSLNMAMRLTSVVSAPMLVGMMVFSEEILSLLFSNSEIGAGAVLLCLLAPAILFASLLTVVNSALEAGGQVRAPIVSMLLGGGCKILVSYLLISNVEFGIGGAPLGTVICYAVALISSIIIYTSRSEARISIISTMLVPYLSAAFAIIAARLLYDRVFLQFSGLISLCLAIFSAALIYAIFLVISGTLRPDILQKTAKYTKTV